MFTFTKKEKYLCDLLYSNILSVVVMWNWMDPKCLKMPVKHLVWLSTLKQFIWLKNEQTHLLYISPKKIY